MELLHFVDEQKEGVVRCTLSNGEVQLNDEYFPEGTLAPPRKLSNSWDMGRSPKLAPAHHVREASVAKESARLPSFDLGENAQSQGAGLPYRDSVGANIRTGESVEVASNMHLGCFMLCGMGATCAYTAILSSLVWYKALFGPSIFLLLNIAVYTPALPIMMLQNSFDERYNAMHGVRTAYRFRVAFCFTCLAGILCLFASERPPDAGFMVGTTLVVGIFAGVAYGTFYQIISLMPDPRCNAYFAMGYQGVALLVLVVGLATGFNADAAEGAAIPISAVTGFFGGCAFLQMTCLAAFLAVDRSSRMYEFALDKKDEVLLSVRSAQQAKAKKVKEIARRAARAKSPGTEPLLSTDGSNEIESLLSAEETAVEPCKPSLTRCEVFYAIWPCAAACSLTICGSIMLFPFYVYMQDSAHNKALPQVLFFTKLTADAVSRPLTMYLQLVKTPRQLLGLALLRTLFIPVFFLYVATDEFGEWNIVWLVLAIAIYSFFSGYIITTSYHMAPRMLDPSLGDDVARIMSLLFQAGLVVALVSALALQQLLKSGLEHTG